MDKNNQAEIAAYAALIAHHQHVEGLHAHPALGGHPIMDLRSHRPHTRNNVTECIAQLLVSLCPLPNVSTVTLQVVEFIYKEPNAWFYFKFKLIKGSTVQITRPVSAHQSTCGIKDISSREVAKRA